MGAQVKLSSPTSYLKCETDITGRCQVKAAPKTTYALQAQKEGYYVLRVPTIEANTGSIELTLKHLQEIKERERKQPQAS